MAAARPVLTCQRAIDQPRTEQFADVEARTRNAEDMLGRIRKALMEMPDIIMRPEMGKILDEA